ncbi:MAG: hypothetical protein AB8H03_21580 [Saprospiraceae bacterium]
MKVELFEIYSKGFKQSKEQQIYFNHPLYCKLLLERVLKLNSVLLSHFLDFQCKALNHPCKWLTSLDLLLEYNVGVLIEINLGSQLNDALNLVNEKRAEYQKVPHFYREDDFEEDNPYRIDFVKVELNKLKTYREKKVYLLRMKTDYLQNQYNYDKEDGVDFDIQIELELDYLKKLEQIDGSESVQSNAVWNGQINQLVDMFFQCLHIKASNGNSLLEVSNEQLVQIIKNTFCKKDGTRFSMSTIRTILKPTRYDKRPKGHKKINVEAIINSSPKSPQEE